jgi:phospholipid/cholesterol/gamma-HCH transport system substrate-binding protein
LFAATAARDRALAATFRAFPAFLAETRTTIARVTRFANATRPLVDELRPAAVALNPALSRTAVLAPELRDLLTHVAPLTRAARQGFPALERFLRSSVPFLARLKPYLGGLVPVVDYIQSYRRELAAFFANSTATTQGVLGSADGRNRHYVRIASPINPELLTPYSGRPSSNRANPYLQPGGYDQLATGLPVFGSYLCTAHALPSLSASLNGEKTAVNGAAITVAQLVSRYYFTPDPSGPRCRAQRALGAVTAGQAQSFPHLRALP